MRRILLFFFLGLYIGVPGQNTIALPEILNYSKQVYKAGTQNWDICQDKSGILYFANNEGMLSFDGTYWKLYPLPNKTIARSVAIAGDNTIYIGGQDEIGYFSPDKTGRLRYHSLKQLIPPGEQSFADIWDIVCLGQQVFFRSNEKILVLDNNRISVHRAVNWLYTGQAGDKVISQDFSNGILFYKNGAWLPLIKKEQMPPGFLLTGSMPAGGDTILLTTLKNGIYLYADGQVQHLLSAQMNTIADYHIYSATLIDADHIGLATSSHGCIIIDRKGNPIQEFSRGEGLQNNNVLSIFPDRNKNLWLGLDNGIDFIAYNSAIKNINPEKDNEGAGYSSIIHDNRLYVATTNGLYSVPLYAKEDLSFVKGNFEPVANARGQVWNLSEVNGQLLMGHHEGAYIINQNKATLLDNTAGFWTFLPFSSILPAGMMAAGTYYGVRFYSFEGNRFVNHNVAVQFESSRFVAIDNNSIWVSHPYKGVYRVSFKNGVPVVESYSEKVKHGLTLNGNYIFRVKNRIVATTEKGIYEYDPQKDAFEPSAYFGNIFGNTIIRYLKEDANGNIWFVFDKNLGVADFSTGKPRIIYITELNRKIVSGFEQVYPVDENNIFVGAEKGYFHINYAKYKRNHPGLQVQLREVRAIGKTDSLLFGGYFRNVNDTQTQTTVPSVSYNWNSFHFEFTSPLFEQQSNIEYSYYLKGYDKKWSEWTDKTEKEYTYLPPGTYNFQVKARNNLGNESAVYSYCFFVLPPWYLTWWAYVIYGCLLLYGAYLIYRWQKRKFMRQRQRYEEEQKRLQYLHQLEVEKYEEEQKHQQYLHQLELEKSEKEIMALRNEKLEAEIAFTNKEMASTTMHLVKKGELITLMKDELQRLTRNTEDERSLDSFKKMIKTLGEEDRMDRDWDHFTVHFDKAHNDFFIALKEKHPNLTPNELKLCAYLRMNLSTKEIAQLMSISVRGVEISRYRLRKKLQIPTETNLFTYFLDFHVNGNRQS